jgi:hypothetical protein
VHGVAVSLADQFFENFEMNVMPLQEATDKYEEEKPEKGWFGKLLDWIKNLTG